MNNNKDPLVIRNILESARTIAVVGFSSETGRAGYYVPAYLQQNCYRIVPVNPKLESGLGAKSYPDLLSVPEKVNLVLIFRRPEAVPEIVEQAIQIGAEAVWMQQGIVHEAAALRARTNGLKVVMDACMMVEHRRRNQAQLP